MQSIAGVDESSVAFMGVSAGLLMAGRGAVLVLLSIRAAADLVGQVGSLVLESGPGASFQVIGPGLGR